jgi:FkbM family methyltransferase
MIIYKNNWWVPAEDKDCFPVVLREVSNVDSIMTMITSRKTCIQAGGNIGIWPKKFSSVFETVYTFEPDDDNWQSMQKNLQNIPNIISKKCALGSSMGTVSIDRMIPKNVGAHRVKEGMDVEKITIDSLNINNVDLIQFDVEGSEHDAILGSVDTIKRNNPLIVLELKGLGKHYGHSDQETIDFLTALGYKHIKTISRDFIFKKT